MTWHYNIIKDKDGYFIGEVFSDKKKKNHSWCDAEILRCDSKDEIKNILVRILQDVVKYKVLTVKKNKLK